MKEHSRKHSEDQASMSAHFIEILHNEGIESAEVWLKGHKINERYDHIEEQYLSSKRIIFTN